MGKLKLILTFFLISALNIYAFFSYDNGSELSSTIITISLVSIFMGAMIILAFIRSLRFKFESGNLMAFIIFVCGVGNVILGLIQIT